MGELDQSEEAVDSSPTPPSGEVGVLLGQLVALGERLDSLEIRQDANSKGVRLDLAFLRDGLEEVVALVRGVAAAQGRLDTERENDRKALRDVSSEIAELAADIDGVVAEIREFRSGRASASNFDAQALQNTLELQAAVTAGNFAALTIAIDGLAKRQADEDAKLRTEIGVAPDKVKGVEGSGVLKAIAEINNARAIAVIAIGTFLAGGGVVAALLQFLGGK